MRLTCVTMSGADETIQASELVHVTRAFPFVEWGICLSTRAGKQGKPTIPGRIWLSELSKITALPIAVHLCGRYVADLIRGRFTFPERFPELFGQCRRVQINLRSTRTPLTDRSRLLAAISRFPEPEYIFQQDSFDLAPVRSATECGLRASILFDTSGGRGRAPSTWPPRDGVSGGYAGGLRPDNLVAQLKRIAAVVDAEQDPRTWIDLRSGVRTGGRFDLQKVECCLAICRPLATES